MDPRTTAALDSIVLSLPSMARPPGLALAIACSRDEPERVGEVALLPGLGRWVGLGRDPLTVDPPVTPLIFHQQRPGSLLATGSLRSLRISRLHLKMRAMDDGFIDVRNVGKRPMLWNGQLCEDAIVRPGDTVGIDRSLLLLCVVRPMELPGLSGQRPAILHPFGEPDPDGLVGESPQAWELRNAIRFAAESRTHVLIQGPSGVGKELVARAIHAHSDRGRKRLVSRNCATIPEGIAEAEFFGNLRNYPNPGTPERLGLIGTADGSSLFLDELGELSQEIQANLLRVMGEGEYSRLGDAQHQRVDVRVIGATNRPESALKHDVHARFKLRIEVPGLDRRREDIPLLVRHLLSRILADNPGIARQTDAGGLGGAPSPALSLIDGLIRSPYQTHIRQIEVLLWRALRNLHGPEIELAPDDGPIPQSLSDLGSPGDRPAAPRASLLQPFGSNSTPGSSTSDASMSGPTPVDLSAPPSDEPVSSATPSFFDRLSPAERQMLDLYRKHRFNASSVAADASAGSSRSTAHFHLRIWMAEALQWSRWVPPDAARLLAGFAEGPAFDAALASLRTFMANLRSHREQSGPDETREYLRRQYRARSGALLALLEWIEAQP